MRLLPLALCVLGISALHAQTGDIAKASPCKIEQLSAHEDLKESEQVGVGLGHQAVTITVQNRSSSPCILQGMPRLSLFNTANRQLSVEVCQNCTDYLFPSQPARELRLEANGSAWVVVAYIDVDGNGTCREAASIGLQIPNQPGTLKIPLRAMRSCGPVTVTPFLGRPLPDPKPL